MDEKNKPLKVSFQQKECKNDKSFLSFKGYTIVSCGTLRRELNYLRDTGFLDADKILYTAPGLHERQTELETNL